MRLLLLLSLLLISLITLGKTQWLGNGARKSEYQTIANNLWDKNGNIVRPKLSGLKDANGQIMDYCTDVMGQRRSNGEEYDRPNGHFKYKCSDGIETITENSCNMNGKLYHVGDEMQSQYFLLQCGENGYKITGCFFRDNNNKIVSLKIGAVTEANGEEHHCEDNNKSIRYYSKALGCTKNGVKYKEGERFAKNHLRYECKEGKATIIGCYMDKEGQNIEIGNGAINNNMLYKCYFEDGDVKFEQYSCGLTGTPKCEIPEGLMKMPAASPRSEQGYRAFSMIQYVQQGTDKIMKMGRQ